MYDLGLRVHRTYHKHRMPLLCLVLLTSQQKEQRDSSVHAMNQETRIAITPNANPERHACAHVFCRTIVLNTVRSTRLRNRRKCNKIHGPASINANKHLASLDAVAVVQTFSFRYFSPTRV